MTIFIDDSEGNTFGYVVIDSIVNNTSSGGVRILEDISLEEIKALAREMTLKYSFMGLPRGGTKSGIKVPFGLDSRSQQRLCEEFGKRIRPLIASGIYHPGMDMNCGPKDLRAIYRGAGLDVGEVTDTSYFTALSVANAIYACREVNGFTHGPMSVAIEGFGSVGSHLVERLPRKGYKLIAVSTIKGAVTCERGLSAEMLLRLRKEFGDELVRHIPDGVSIKKEEVLTCQVDILVPSARTWVINETNAKTIGAHFVVPVANAPYTKEALHILEERGVVCLPGFVTNSGGVYGSSLYDSGVSMKDIERVSSFEFQGAVKSLLLRSRNTGTSPAELATLVALRRRQANRGKKVGVVERGLKKAFTRGMFPKSVYARLRLREFRNNLSQLVAEIKGLAKR